MSSLRDEARKSVELELSRPLLYAEPIDIERARAMTPTERLAEAMRLTTLERQAARKAIVEANPHFSEREVMLKMVEHFYDRELAEEVCEHLRQRDAAASP